MCYSAGGRGKQGQSGSGSHGGTKNHEDVGKASAHDEAIRKITEGVQRPENLSYPVWRPMKKKTA